MKYCKSCEQPIPAGRRSDAKYCDKNCKKRAENRRLYVPRIPEDFVRQPTCDHCSGPIPADKKPTAKYCSREHMLRAAAARRRPLEPERDRARYHSDVEAARAKGRVKYENRRGWKANNPGFVAVTEKDWTRLCNFYKNTCAYCSGPGPLQQDHVIPLSRGGRHAIANILPACSICNYSKGSSFVAEWKYRK